MYLLRFIKILSQLYLHVISSLYDLAKTNLPFYTPNNAAIRKCFNCYLCSLIVGFCCKAMAAYMNIFDADLLHSEVMGKTEDVRDIMYKMMELEGDF